MKCGYYCNGYCFWNGDTGEVCDKIAYGTHKRIKDGYCPKEQNAPGGAKNGNITGYERLPHTKADRAGVLPFNGCKR